MKKELMVSVSMLTYKHESFIKEAIEGVLMQETNFNYELIIADDCSPDNTQEIVNDFIKNHPKGNLIRYFRHSKNIGMSANGIFAIKKCKATYIALCEGDDYWIDPLKLQKQVDFLEVNPKFSICFTNTYELYENKINKSRISLNLGCEKDYESNLYDFLNPYYCYTATCVFRNLIEFKSLENYKNFKDVFAFSIILKHGDMYLINQITSVYRLHNGGVSSLKSKHHNLLNDIGTFKEMSRYHKFNIPMFNESYLWSLIELKFSKNTNLKQKIIYTFNFLAICFRKTKYFSLFFKDFIRLF